MSWKLCLVVFISVVIDLKAAAVPVDSSNQVGDSTSGDASSSSSSSQPSSTTEGLVIVTQPESAVLEEDEDPEEENPGKRPTVRSLTINSTIQFRYSVTECTSRVLNPDSSANEVTFSLTLPDSAFISKFSMTIKGKTYEALIKEKEAAKEIYDAAVSAGHSAGHVAVNPRDSNRFSVSVNVAAKEKVTFRLVYEELLLRKVGRYEQRINLDPGQLVPELVVEANIAETRNFTKVRVPELRKGVLEKDEIDNPLAKIDYIDGNKVKITYAPTIQDQKRLRDNKKGISGEFVIQYDINHDPKGELYVSDGYFVHFLSPDEKHFKTLRKHVVFVIDLSGSMHGTKLEQTQDAMKTILKEMNQKDDYLSIVTFSSGAKVWQPPKPETGNITVDTDPLAPVKATPDLITRANNFVDSWEADGYTNIDLALRMAFDQAGKKIPVEDNSVDPVTPMVVFLTDGVPTQGELDSDRIVSNVIKRNAAVKQKITLFTLGFGDDLNFDLLKKAGLKNGGFARKIYADSDATLQLTGFFDEISHPVLTDVNITYIGDEVEKNSTASTLQKTAFRGSELVTVGKLTPESNSISEYIIKANGREGPVAFNSSKPIVIPSANSTGANGTQYSNFLERLWAYQTVRHYLERLDAGFESDNTTDLKTKAKDIALKFSFVTELTSLVVVKPDDEPKVTPTGQRGSSYDLDTADALTPLSIGGGSSGNSLSKVQANSFRPASLSGGGYQAPLGLLPFAIPALIPAHSSQPFSYGLAGFPAAPPPLHLTTTYTPPRTQYPSSTHPGDPDDNILFFQEEDDEESTQDADPVSTDAKNNTETITGSTPAITTTEAETSGVETDVLSKWLTAFLSSDKSFEESTENGTTVLVDTKTQEKILLNMTADEFDVGCGGANTTNVCGSIAFCAPKWNACDLSDNPLEILFQFYPCEIKQEDNVLKGLCCPEEDVAEKKCPTLPVS